MDLSYPIGRFEWPESVTPQTRAQWIGEIEAAPAQFRAAVQGLTGQQLDTPIARTAGRSRRWCTTSPIATSTPMSAFAWRSPKTSPPSSPMTSPNGPNSPTRARPGRDLAPAIDSLHQRWALLLRSMSEADFARTFLHPERGIMRLDLTLAMYACTAPPCAHIAGLRSGNGLVIYGYNQTGRGCVQ